MELYSLCIFQALGEVTIGVGKVEHGTILRSHVPNLFVDQDAHAPPQCLKSHSLF